MDTSSTNTIIHEVKMCSYMFDDVNHLYDITCMTVSIQGIN